ncbi:SapC protein, putative [Oceanicola granulosus HTCC2516]|uniref:SapC protein, putative n=1 Tax=Oceanicola granulosus (strain ATCC BAA-861 / DSM 15982 / KCTC 12143 / HTCC2516) TaxID=314256 RepID=Q2CDE3_OCEGH|nr:SapC family protein [Oceanicola granulosus]EAR50647.1 SapC protein, putative [Oceanicola granulosus HTCC2516]
MAKQLMIYERAVPISSERHRDWSVETGGNYGFAREVNSVPLLAAEFIPAATDHAIVFAGSEEAVFPSVILGIRDNENSHVGPDGSWTGGYIPAFLRRYPFVFSRSDDGETFTLCMDEEYEGFNQDGRGERLFDSTGQRTQYLESILNFTREYQTLFDRTQQFCARLVEHDLLRPGQANFNLGDLGQAQLGGFFTLDRQKLKELPQEVLSQMLATDELELCYVHLQSLNNLTPMAQRIAAAGGAAAPDGDGDGGAGARESEEA